MGFDLYGQNKDENGESLYFRNNCWWWRPLWGFVEMQCKEVMSQEEFEKCNYNDGYLVIEEKAKKIAEKLEELLEKGFVEMYEKSYEVMIRKLPDVKCDICKGIGLRNDKFIKGKCPTCEGKGMRRPWAVNYPFSEENVREFMEFCKKSGGFQVW